MSIATVLYIRPDYLHTTVTMIERPFWLKRISEAWQEVPIAWLSGVRRSGKTTLAQSLGEDQVHYINCDLPAVEDMVRDPIGVLQAVGRFAGRPVQTAVFESAGHALFVDEAEAFNTLLEEFLLTLDRD